MANKTKVMMTKSNCYTKIMGIRQLLVTSAVALPLLASISSVQAATLSDTENNNATANQTASMYVGGLFTNVNGTVSASDRVDVYSFKDQGAPEGEFNVYWHQQRGAPHLAIWKDKNKNKRLDANVDRLVSVIDPSDPTTIRTAPNQMFLAVVNHVGRTGKSEYNMHVSVPKKLHLKVYKAKSFGKFDNGDPGDFYVSTRFSGALRKSKTIKNDDTPSFDHSHFTNAHETTVPFEIDILDKDSKGRFSRKNRDDRADINPSPKAKKLSLTYNLVSNQVRTAPEGKLIGTSGGPAKTIKTKGDKKGDQVEVEFAIF